RLERRDPHVQAVAGAHGPRPAHLVDAGRPHARYRRDEMVDEQAHHDAAGHPPAGDQPPVDRFAGGLPVDMEGLRIVAPRELDDLLLGDEVIAELDDFTGSEILEVALLVRHGHEWVLRGGRSTPPRISE